MWRTYNRALLLYFTMMSANKESHYAKNRQFRLNCTIVKLYHRDAIILIRIFSIKFIASFVLDGWLKFSTAISTHAIGQSCTSLANTVKSSWNESELLQFKLGRERAFILITFTYGAEISFYNSGREVRAVITVSQEANWKLSWIFLFRSLVSRTKKSLFKYVECKFYSVFLPQMTLN